MVSDHVMDTKEYIVVLRPGVDYNQFWNEIEKTSSQVPHIPDRPVRVAHNRTYFDRICEYWLTDQEAEQLKNDPRIEAVEIPVRNLSEVQVVNHATQNIPGMNYTKQAGNIFYNYTNGISSQADPDYMPPQNASINWGLIRHSFDNNPYPANPSGNSASTIQVYNYALDGSDVDIIINDSGIQYDHPEFAGRIQFVNWNAIALAVGSRSSFDWNTASYTDSIGHGTNVAGIAAGKTYGWAKGARVIPLYLNPLAGQSSVEPLDMFEMMIYWHRRKGNNRPTIVNMSWDLRYNFPGILNYGTFYYAIIDYGSYRGSSWSGPQTSSFYQDRGLIALTGNGFPIQPNPDPVFPYSSAAYNAALGQVIDAGIVVCQAAGNNGFKIDKPTADGGSGDYNNYFGVGPNLYYYHRGASPKDPRAIVVGALDSKTSPSGQDARAQFSAAGPRIDVWAAGSYIMSAGCNTSGQQYNGYYISNQTGTSQATPQVTGICSLYLQTNPPANIYNANNSSSVKSWLSNNAVTDTFYHSGNATTYTDSRSLLGGQPKVAYQSLSGATEIKTAYNQWRTIRSISIKNNLGDWDKVSQVYVKTNSGWRPVFTDPA